MASESERPGGKERSIHLERKEQDYQRTNQGVAAAQAALNRMREDAAAQAALNRMRDEERKKK